MRITFMVRLVSKTKRSRERSVNHEVRPQNIELKRIRLKENNINVIITKVSEVNDLKIEKI